MRVQAALRRLIPGVVVLLLSLTLCGWGMWTLQRNWSFVAAARSGNIGQVQADLDRGMDPNTVSQIGGITALRMAISGGHASTARLLLDRGADPTGGLDQAIVKGDSGLVKLLISRGANVNVRYVTGATPLRAAEETKNRGIIKLLKAAGARE